MGTIYCSPGSAPEVPHHPIASDREQARNRFLKYMPKAWYNISAMITEVRSAMLLLLQAK